MKTITFFVAGLVCLFTTAMNGQTFEQKTKEISENIEKITQNEKELLKMEVEEVNNKLENGEITEEEAEAQKKAYAEKRAKNIEELVSAEEEKLAQLVKDKVDGKIEQRRSTFEISYNNTKQYADSLKERENNIYRRTTSHLVFAFGVNRVVVDGEIDDTNYKWRSDFYEWGITWNTRILKNNNLLHAKYGLSLQYNNLRPNHNKKFVTDNGQTYLQDSGLDLKVSRFRYVNLVVPVYLEFDFTPKRDTNDKVYFPKHQSFRIGVGGYAGVNVKEKQILKYNEDGHKIRTKEKGDFNVNDFAYGVAAYIGYGDVSLYAKYDLQPIFNNNPVDQNTLSMGIRFDF